MKRLIICCDGTWNGLQKKCPTNVVKISQACKSAAADGTPQILYYDEGLGTSGGLDKWLGGAFGLGIDKNIEDAYRFLCLNYEPGDEVYLFGFSRGAYTVRSLAGMIYCSGLLSRQHIRQTPAAYQIYRDRRIRPHDSTALEFRQAYNSQQIEITLIGCWDTVGALGIPQIIPWLPINELVNHKYKFHDTKLNRKVRWALHAMAIDERRRPFDINHMNASDNAPPDQEIREVWFPGTHGCVGGGSLALQGLSDGALQWMTDQIAALGLGLEFDLSRVENGIHPDYNSKFFNNLGAYRLMGTIDRDISGTEAGLHVSVIKRYRALASYRPSNLMQRFKGYLESFSHPNA